MSAPRYHREPGQRRKPYSRPRNARRDAVLSARAALALTWVPPFPRYGEMRRLAAFLDRQRVRFAAAGEREAAVEMQRLRYDVLASWNKPAIQSVTVDAAREETAA